MFVCFGIRGHLTFTKVADAAGKKNKISFVSDKLLFPLISKNACSFASYILRYSTFLCNVSWKIFGLKLGRSLPLGVGVAFLWWVYFFSKNGFPKKLRERNFKKKIFQIRIRISDITSDGANSRIVLFNCKSDWPESTSFSFLPRLATHIYEIPLSGKEWNKERLNQGI